MREQLVTSVITGESKRLIDLEEPQKWHEIYKISARIARKVTQDERKVWVRHFLNYLSECHSEERKNVKINCMIWSFRDEALDYLIQSFDK